jgi:hypothetical protein
MSMLNPPVTLLNSNGTTTSISNGPVFTTTSFIPGMFMPSIDVDTGMNDNYYAQKQMTNYLYYRVLDKWLYDDDMCHILKYLKVSGNSVSVVSSINDYKDNKICNDSIEDVEKKVDFIESNIFSQQSMRKVLVKITQELGYKWYDLPTRESIVIEAVGKYIRRKLKEKIPDAHKEK